MNFLDGVSLYSSILTVSHPFSDFLLMDSTNYPFLFDYYTKKIINYDSAFFANEKRLKNFLFFATVHVTYNPQLAKWTTSDLSAFPSCRSIHPSEISLVQKQWFKASGKKVPQNTRLVSSCQPSTISQHLELLFFECLFLGASITRVEKIVRAKGFPIFKSYIDGLNKKRQSEESAVHSKIIKSLSNCLAGG